MHVNDEGRIEHIREAALEARETVQEDLPYLLEKLQP